MKTLHEPMQDADRPDPTLMMHTVIPVDSFFPESTVWLDLEERLREALMEDKIPDDVTHVSIQVTGWTREQAARITGQKIWKQN